MKMFLKAEMIYGDDFPNTEQIAKRAIFEPITLYSQKVELQQFDHLLLLIGNTITDRTGQKLLE